MNSKSNQKIKELAKSVHKLAVKAIAYYSREVGAIIVFGSRDKHRIESALDGMLDFCFDKNMLKLYRRLCKYYCNFNWQAAVEYVYAYRDMWDTPFYRGT